MDAKNLALQNEEDSESLLKVDIKKTNKMNKVTNMKEVKANENTDVKTSRNLKSRYSEIRRNAIIVFSNTTAYPFLFKNGFSYFKCFICSKLFDKLAQLNTHMADHNATELKNKVLKKLSEHSYKVDVTDLKCTICSCDIKDLHELNKHLETHHINLDPAIKNNLVPFNSYLLQDGCRCFVCKEQYTRMRMLMLHMGSHFRNYSCEICGEGFLKLRDVKKHVDEVHEKGNYPCETCGKVFNHHRKRDQHNKIVHLNFKFLQCPMCPERFNNRYKKIKHLQNIHDQDMKLYKCDHCDASYLLNSSLQTHIKGVHFNEKNYKCDYCDLMFLNKSRLKRHMPKHSGVKDFKCHVCQKTFTWRKNLNAHLKIHMNHGQL